ncbi:MAG: hypothetical protein FWC60_12000 [Firmicutes bacterium]|nr:hypothetical protein [Bacillota bacterium]
MLIRKVNTARQTVNRKRFLGEHERTVYSRFEVRGSILCMLVGTQSPGTQNY